MQEPAGAGQLSQGTGSACCVSPPVKQPDDIEHLKHPTKQIEVLHIRIIQMVLYKLELILEYRFLQKLNPS